MLQHKLSRSLAVAVMADRTVLSVYDVRYSYRLLSGKAVVSMSIYVQFRTDICFDACQLSAVDG